MNPQIIQDTITANLDTEYVLAESEDNVHFYVTVVSAEFANVSKIQQHKMVKSLFTEAFNNDSIHALSLKTLPPEKWAQQQEANSG